MPPNVPMTETGTATTGISVARALRRNSHTTSVTSATDSTRVVSVSASEARMLMVLSEANWMSISFGSAAFSLGTAALTASTVWMTLAPGSLNTITSTAGLPLARPRLRRSCTPSSTEATSVRWTAAPLR